jgi:hypothetical protein
MSVSAQQTDIESRDLNVAKVPLPEVIPRAIRRLVGDNKRPYLTLPGTTNRYD